MKNRSSRRAKACGITQSARQETYDRDHWQCIFNGPRCEHNRMLTPAHVVSAAKGGMGKKENLVTACIPCHDIFDHGTREERNAMHDKAVAYLKQFYPNWDENSMIYHKYD